MTSSNISAFHVQQLAKTYLFSFPSLQQALPSSCFLPFITFLWFLPSNFKAEIQDSKEADYLQKSLLLTAAHNFGIQNLQTGKP